MSSRIDDEIVEKYQGYESVFCVFFCLCFFFRERY
jgi:hypothetical protein